MQSIKDNDKSNKSKIKSILPIRAVYNNAKKLFVLWLVVAVAAAAILSGYNIIHDISNRKIQVSVNFSFDGVESGHDPSGNKFDVNDIKSKSAIKKSLDELELEYDDINEIYASISISGNVPRDVINRITNYSSIYSSENSIDSKRIQDTTYYPTQYTITMSCHEVDLKFDDCVNLLNKLTENYKQTFFTNYGYKKSLETAVTAIDYNDYDYVDAVSVFDSSLLSLQDYINELADKDETRFRSEKSGYSFADLSQSIETIRTEDLDMISSYITIYNVTKDKENLIVNYKFKIEELERNKKINEEKIQALAETIDAYEKNSILIFANATSGTDATLNQSTDTYDKLIDEQIAAQKEFSNCEQQIAKYNKRIKALEGSLKKGSEDKIKEDFEKINNKINTLLESVNITVSEYYEDVVLKNAYMILSDASNSTLSIIKKSLSETLPSIFSVEFIIIAIYLIICCAAVNEKVIKVIGKIKFVNKTSGKKRKVKGR